MNVKTFAVIMLVINVLLFWGGVTATLLAVVASILNAIAIFVKDEKRGRILILIVVVLVIVDAVSTRFGCPLDMLKGGAW